MPAAESCSFFLEPIPFIEDISSLSTYLIISEIVSYDVYIAFNDHAVLFSRYASYLYTDCLRFSEPEHFKVIFNSFKNPVGSLGNIFSIHCNYIYFDLDLILFFRDFNSIIIVRIYYRSRFFLNRLA